MTTTNVATRRIHTADSVRAFLDTNPCAVERAIVLLFDRQTSDEQATEATRHDNARGFNAADAKRFSFIAKWLKQDTRRHLKADTCARYLKRVRKYARQLAEMANERAAARVARTTEVDEESAAA